ncbi:hypothetical protein Tco_0332655 [Tanacetum coccineum]
MEQLPPRAERHLWLRYEGQEYTDTIIQDFKERLGRIFGRQTGISSSGDFLTTVSSYTAIKEPLRRLCHYLIAFTIAGKGQAPEKYLFRHAKGRKQGVRMSRGYFVARLAEHFGLITEKSLQGLTVVVCDLTMIDMDELVAAAKAAQLDLEIPKEVVQADPAPAQAPQAPPAAPAPRNIPQRLQRLEEEVRGLCESFREQRLVVDTLSRDFSRFTTWAVGRLGRLLDASSVTYPSYPVIHQPRQEMSTEMLLVKEKLIKAIRTCLKNNNQPPEEKSIAVLLAEESILTVMQTLEEKQIDNRKYGKKLLALQLSKDWQNSYKMQLKPEKPEVLFAFIFDNSPDFNNDPGIFSNPLFDSNDDYTSIDDESFSEEDVLVENFKVYSNPLLEFDEEIFSSEINPLYNEVLEDLDSIPPGNENDHFNKIDPHHFNAESDLIESLLNKNTVITSLKIDFLLEEFAGSLLSIQFHQELLKPTLIRRKIFSDSASEIFNDDLAHIISQSEYEYVYADDESDSGDLTTDVVKDILGDSTRKLQMSHRVFKALKISHTLFNKSPMMIYGGDMPILDVPCLHFYPP